MDWGGVSNAVETAFKIARSQANDSYKVGALGQAYAMFADRMEQQLIRDTGVDFLPSGRRSKPFSVQKKPLIQPVKQKTKPWRSCEGPLKWLQQRVNAFAGQ
eukprot:6759162-Alexandrium_andersonii.AAC.1